MFNSSWKKTKFSSRSADRLLTYCLILAGCSPVRSPCRRTCEPTPARNRTTATTLAAPGQLCNKKVLSICIVSVYNDNCCCCLPCNHCSNGHGLLKKFWPFGNWPHSTYCREFLYVKLYRPAYFVRTNQLYNYNRLHQCTIRQDY